MHIKQNNVADEAIQINNLKLSVNTDKHFRKKTNKQRTATESLKHNI